MFLNISNHPIAKWDDAQVSAAVKLGGYTVVDMPFPAVPAFAETGDVTMMARRIVAEICDKYGIPDDGPDSMCANAYVMVQGEFSLTFELSRMLLALGWHVCVACSDRNAVENSDGTKTVKFEFRQFRMLRG